MNGSARQEHARCVHVHTRWPLCTGNVGCGCHDWYTAVSNLAIVTRVSLCSQDNAVA